MTHRLAAAFAAFLLLPVPSSAQSWDDNVKAQIETYLKSRPERQLQVEVGPDAPVMLPDEVRIDLRWDFQKRMALAGHGVLFDIDGKRVTLSLGDIAAIQSEMLQALAEEKPAQSGLAAELGDKLAGLAEKIAAAEQGEGVTPEERLLLANTRISTLAYRLEETMREAFDWRASFLRDEMIRNGIKLTDGARRINLDFIDIIGPFFARTAYMADCARAGVPVPPDFSPSGSDWTYQGNLTTNMLRPGQAAQVWTWASPTQRGACIALPRDAGGPGALAGIICQSATTGNACFWDNRERRTNDIIPWATEPLVITQLVDGSNIREAPCTGCHRGNNVFLVAPDDPTWCRLLRGNPGDPRCLPPSGPNAANLTLALEAVVNPLVQPNTSVIHARYTPMSGTPPRAAWTNTTAVSSGCGGICHLSSTGAFTPPTMPPACGVSCR